MIRWRAFREYIPKSINSLNADAESINIHHKNNVSIKKMKKNQLDRSKTKNN